MRWRRPPAPPGRLPPPPGGRDPPPLDRRDDGGRRCNGSGESGSPATATMSMPVIDIGALFIGREDWEGDDGSGVATEDDNDTEDAEAGGYTHLGRAFREEEECDSLLRLADGILLRSIVATAAGAAATAVGSTAIATMLMPVIDIGALFIGREDREGDDGSGVETEDDDDTNAEAGGYAHWGGAFCEEDDDNEDGDEQGQQARRKRHAAVDVRDSLQGQAVVVVVHGSPKAPIARDNRGEGGRGGSVADETIMDGATTAATTERGMRR